MTLEQMTLILLKSSSYFPNLSFTAEFIKGWHDLFERYEAYEFLAAINSAIIEPGREFFPTPGAVNKYLVKTVSKIEAFEVWEEIIKLASSAKNEKQVAELLKDNPVGYPALLAVGGLKKIALADIEKDLPFLKNQFLKVYFAEAEDVESFTRIETSREIAKERLTQIFNHKPQGLEQ